MLQFQQIQYLQAYNYNQPCDHYDILYAYAKNMQNL